MPTLLALTSTNRALLPTVRSSLNVFAPAIVCAPAVTSPRAEALASGMLNVWVEPLEEMPKSVPAVPVANVCVGADVVVRPLRLRRPAPSFTASVSTVQSLPVQDSCHHQQ